MTDEPENATLRLLREIRERIDSMQESINGLHADLVETKSDVAIIKMDVGLLKDRLNNIAMRVELQTQTIGDMTRLLQRREGVQP